MVKVRRALKREMQRRGLYTVNGYIPAIAGEIAGLMTPDGKWA